MMQNNNKPSVLVVDDNSQNIAILCGFLHKQYRIQIALSGEKALKIASNSPKPNMILLDVMMPDMDGYTVCRLLKSDPATADIPVIFVTGLKDEANERKGFELGAVDFITKPISRVVVEARLRTHLALFDHSCELTLRINKRTEELNQTRLEIIRCLGRAAEFKDNETGHHVIRMSHYAKLIAQAYQCDETWVDLVFNAAPMHDIGKIGIPDHILLKPGKLDADEWAIMQKHTEFASIIIGNYQSELLHMSQIIALTHHEKWDGSGYPKGLAGNDIPLVGRIVAIADVFDALVSKRPYKDAWPVEDAVNEIDQGSGSHFDPALVPLFHKVLPEILKIKAIYQDE